MKSGFRVETHTMPKYRFIVQSPSGKVRRGSISEKDESTAQASLESAGFKVVSISESTDLVVHTASGNAAASGRPRTVPERAALIEFEDSIGEKFTKLLNTYFLRREFTMLLAVAGLVWIVFAWAGKPEKAPPAELEYKAYNITVTIDNTDFPDSGRAQIRIPEIPFTTTEDLKSDTPPHTVEILIEAAKEPKTVEITLIEGTATKVARGQSILQAGAEAGTFSVQSPEFTQIEEER
jgi:hypothetical protein